jgi:phage terminase large subunit-like protein
MVEGESGVMSIAADWNRPVYEPSKRRVTWPNGALATLYSADEYERLRGPQHDAAWVDELCSWRYPQAAWDNLMLGLRLGKNPRCVVTTTPKPTRLIRDLLKREGQDVAVTRGRTEENRANLAPAFYSEIAGRYLGTRIGRQELDAEILDDVPGALWSREQIETLRVIAKPATLSRVVVAIDPSGGGEDEAGIVVVGLGADGHGYVLQDLSGKMGSTEWAKKAIRAYHVHEADRVVAEGNFGGDMVEATLRSIDPAVSFKKVTASRGKVARAEPVAALYEQGRVHHVGAFPALEDQMCGFTNDFDSRSAGYSPGRVDALVWAATELMLGESAQGWVEHYQRMAANGGRIEAPPEGSTPSWISTPLAAAPAAPAVATATMRATPNTVFKAGSKRYRADAQGLLRGVAEADVGVMERLGAKIEVSE